MSKSDPLQPTDTFSICSTTVRLSEQEYIEHVCIKHWCAPETGQLQHVTFISGLPKFNPGTCHLRITPWHLRGRPRFRCQRIGPCDVGLGRQRTPSGCGCRCPSLHSSQKARSAQAEPLITSILRLNRSLTAEGMSLSRAEGGRAAPKARDINHATPVVSTCGTIRCELGSPPDLCDWSVCIRGVGTPTIGLPSLSYTHPYQKYSSN